jgi:hypothetical protein
MASRAQHQARSGVRVRASPRNGTRAVPLGAKAGGDDEGDAGQRPGSGHLAEQHEPGG